MTIEVRPELIHETAVEVQEQAGNWGEAWDTLESDVSDTSSLFGGDEIGRAVAGRYDPYAPKAITFSQEVGFCLAETARGLGDVAGAYTDVELGNEARAQKVQEIIEGLGR